MKKETTIGGYVRVRAAKFVAKTLLMVASILLSACGRSSRQAPDASASTTATAGFDSLSTSLAILASEPARFNQKSVIVVGTVSVEGMSSVGNAVRDPSSGLALWLIPDREPRMRFVTPQRCRVQGIFDSDLPPGPYLGSLHVQSISDCAPLLSGTDHGGENSATVRDAG
jgi:hypothetical protein